MQKPALEEGDTFYDKASAIVIYLPVPISLLLVLPSGIILLVALFRRNFALRTDALVILITTGSALTLFAQYSLLPPDTPALSPSSWFSHGRHGMLRLGPRRWAATRPPDCDALRCRRGDHLPHRPLALFLPRDAQRSPPALSPRKKHKRRYQLVAENGVDVLLKRQSATSFEGSLRTLSRNTQSPAITSSPIPTRPLSISRRIAPRTRATSTSTTRTTSPVSTRKPWPRSRSTSPPPSSSTTATSITPRNPASQTGPGAHLRLDQKNYAYAGTYRRQEVYLRPDLYTPPPGKLKRPPPDGTTAPLPPAHP